MVNVTIASVTKLVRRVRTSSEFLLRNTIYGVYAILIVTPIGVYSNALGDVVVDTAQKDTDNLVFIKSALYEYVPTLSLTVVMVLLVALIGAKVVA